MTRKPADGRAVTTTELTATNAAERNALTHLAADARMLTHNTHPNLVPVVEARWLAANRLAILRTKVKGTSLRQTIDAVGPMPEPRVTEILKDVGEVLEWAARGNIVHRYVSSEGVCLQKGSGRVLVSFGLPSGLQDSSDAPPPDTSFLLDRCADGATLARLGYEMLTGHQPGDASVESLKAVRPDASGQMVAAIEAGLSCLTGAPALGAQQFLAMLPGGDAPRATVAGIATAASAPVVPRAAAVPVPPPSIPLSNRPADAEADVRPTVDPAPVPVAAPAAASAAPAASPAASRSNPPSMTGAPPARHAPRRKGRGMLIASLIALVLVVGATFALIQRERGRDETRVATNARNADDAGDVDVMPTEPLPADPGGLTTDGQLPRQGIDSGLPSSLPSNVDEPLPNSLPSSTPALPPSLERPAPAPTPAAPAPVIPEPATPQQPIPGTPPSETAPPVAAATGCASTAMADQRACLDGIIAASDQELTSVYQALLRSVEERRGASAVEDVRVRQRAWLQRRDDACRRPAAVDGTLWARERGACLARQSDARALELARELAAVRSQP